MQQDFLQCVLQSSGFYDKITSVYKRQWALCTLTLSLCFLQEVFPLTKNYLRIPIILSANSFKAFANFDTMQRQKKWRYPVTASAAFFIAAVVMFSLQEKFPNGFIPGCIFIAAAAGISMNYFNNFNKSLQQQVEKMKLDPPRHVYTVELSDDAEGVKYYHPKELHPAGSYSWKAIYGAWRTRNAVYLYVSEQQALLFPLSTKKINQDEIWAFLSRRLDASRLHDVSSESIFAFLKK